MRLLQGRDIARVPVRRLILRCRFHVGLRNVHRIRLDLIHGEAALRALLLRLRSESVTCRGGRWID